MTPLEFIRAKRAHAARLTNQSGAAGELTALGEMRHWHPRPSGVGKSVLLQALHGQGIDIKASSFDAIHIPDADEMDFCDAQAVRRVLPHMTFIEIKTANQSRVKPGFTGFFFALTEAEICAAEALGTKHRVALFNSLTNELLLTSVPEILARSKSQNWQVSVQL